jgi:hypothetical protein
MTTTETPFLAFWRAANAPLVAIGLPPLDIEAAQRLYGIHCARVRAEGCDPASAPVMVLGLAS